MLATLTNVKSRQEEPTWCNHEINPLWRSGKRVFPSLILAENSKQVTKWRSQQSGSTRREDATVDTVWHLSAGGNHGDTNTSSMLACVWNWVCSKNGWNSCWNVPLGTNTGLFIIIIRPAQKQKRLSGRNFWQFNSDQLLCVTRSNCDWLVTDDCAWMYVIVWLTPRGLKFRTVPDTKRGCCLIGKVDWRKVLLFYAT